MRNSLNLIEERKSWIRSMREMKKKLCRKQLFGQTWHKN